MLLYVIVYVHAETRLVQDMQRERWRFGPTTELLTDRQYLANRRVLWQVEDGTVVALFIQPSDGHLALALSPEKRPKTEVRFPRDLILAGSILTDLSDVFASSKVEFGMPIRQVTRSSGPQMEGRLIDREKVGGTNVYLRTYGKKIVVMLDEAHDGLWPHQLITTQTRYMIGSLSKDRRRERIIQYLTCNGKFL